MMMIIWCFCIYFTGRGLYRMWSSVIGGAVTDWLMLPATLLSELLYSGGRLMTGRPVYAGIIAPQNVTADPCRVAISGKNGFWVEMLSAGLAM
ncbi:MAG TPA: hypothetical protein PLK08_08650, partial [Phycisphaerae bacterium]|nr:hypothetical protein [Phycisphaerae bacterium]